MKALVGAFNQEKALVGVFSVIVQHHRLTVCSTTLTRLHALLLRCVRIRSFLSAASTHWSLTCTADLSPPLPRPRLPRTLPRPLSPSGRLGGTPHGHVLWALDFLLVFLPPPRFLLCCLDSTAERRLWTRGLPWGRPCSTHDGRWSHFLN